jgi:hypothetical protein
MDKLDAKPGWILVAGPTFALSAAAIGLSYLVYTDTIAGGEATAIATVLLVVLTGVYATVTYQMMLETRKSRKQEIMPVFEFQSEEIRSYIQNVGGGPARKLDLTISLLPADKSVRVKRQSLPAGATIAITAEPFSSLADRAFQDLQLESEQIDLHENSDENIWEELDEYPYEELALNGECEDAWGNTIEIHEKYELWNFMEGLGGFESTRPPN